MNNTNTGFTKNSCGVFITRAQPFHNGHLNLILDAMNEGGMKYLKIFIGSANQERTIKNPFSFSERHFMILQSLKELPLKVEINALNDNLYNDQRWSLEFLSKLYADGAQRKYILLGYEKDESSAYLKWFPELTRWTPKSNLTTYESFPSETTVEDKIINATDIRRLFFNESLKLTDMRTLSKMMPVSVQQYLANFNEVEFTYMKEQFNFIEDYKKRTDIGPYSPTFVTTDAIVTTNNCLLMIQRKKYPDKGKWALPGGYLGKNESIKQSMLRELKEETRVKVPEKVLEGSIERIEVFDAVDRDSRGRVITHCFHIPLKTGYPELPHVSGSSDATKAQWIPLTDVVNMQNLIAFDHWSIISYILGI